MVTMQQSFLIVTFQGALIITDKCEGRTSTTFHATIKYYMLLFAGCNDDHIAPRYDQQRKYAKLGYGEYAGDGMYIAKGVYVAKGKYIEYAKDSMYIAKGSMASMPRRTHPSRKPQQASRQRR
jgi:hypothetical protein